MGYLESAPSNSSGRPGRDPVEIEVRIEPQPDGRFRAEVWLERDDAEGPRTFVGSDCRDVAEAAALIAAMLVDAGHAAEPGSDDAASDAVRRPLRIALGVHVLGDAGSVPKPTLGGGLSLGLRWGRLHGGLRASAFLPRTTESGPRPGSGGELGLYVAGLSGGFELVRAFDQRLGSGPLLGLEAGLMVGQGRGLALPRTERQPWLAPSLGWAVLLTGDAYCAGLRAEVFAPLLRPSWVLDDFGELFRVPAAVGRLSLEVAWLLP